MTAIETRRGAQPPDSNEPSLTALASELSEEIRQLTRLEVELAKAEVHDAVGHAKKAGAGFGAAGMLGYIGVLFLSFALAFGLAELLPTWVAFVVVALIWGAAAAVGYSVGRKNLDAFDPVPRRTVESIKEDVTWLRHRTS